MARVIWRNTALDDLDRISDHIRTFDADAAQRIAARLIACGESLSTFPRRGRSGADGMREMTTVPPYILRYETDGDDVFILAVRHGARRPD